MTMRNIRFVAPLCAIAFIVGCTDNPNPAADGSSTEQATPSAAAAPTGQTLRGSPVKSLSCPLAKTGQQAASKTRFNTVTELVVCDLKDGSTDSSALANTDPGFATVMKSLTAKDAKPLALGCTGELRHPSQHHLTVLASTANGAYQVHIPYGYCGEMQQAVTNALKSAGVKVPVHTTI